MTATLFKQVNYDLDSLTKFIELGQIGLPDIQRPFVWANKKVRDHMGNEAQLVPTPLRAKAPGAAAVHAAFDGDYIPRVGLAAMAAQGMDGTQESIQRRFA